MLCFSQCWDHLVINMMTGETGRPTLQTRAGTRGGGSRGRCTGGRTRTRIGRSRGRWGTPRSCYYYHTSEPNTGRTWGTRRLAGTGTSRGNECWRLTSWREQPRESCSEERRRRNLINCVESHWGGRTVGSTPDILTVTLLETVCTWEENEIQNKFKYKSMFNVVRNTVVNYLYSASNPTIE